MHPLLLQNLAAEHVRDMQVIATASRRARWTRRGRRSPAGLARPAAGRQPLAASAAFHR